MTTFESILSDRLPSSSFWSISLNRTWSSSLISTNHQMYELLLLGFPRHALVLILDDAFVWSFESELWFIAKYYFQLCESVYNPRRIPWECTPLQFCGMSCRRLQWVAWICVLCNSQLLSSWIFFTAFSLRLLSLCDSFACASRPCSSSFDQLRLSGVIGSKFHICNFDLGFPWIAPSVETFTTVNISECCFWSSRGTSCPANNSRFYFIDNFDDASFQHRQIRNGGVDTVCQNSFLRRAQ